MAKTLACQGQGKYCTCFDPHITLRLNFNFLDLITTTPSHSRMRSDILPSGQAMNERSYDMCTENLGNETGCEMPDTTMHPYTENESAPLAIVVSKKSVSRSFPPPLTTMSGAESILMSPYREDGRLVIKATRSPSSMFWTERRHGRLRMSILGYCDEEEVVVDEGEMILKGVEDMMMVKVGGSSGRCKQGEPQYSRVFNWEPFNWVATA